MRLVDFLKREDAKTRRFWRSLIYWGTTDERRFAQMDFMKKVMMKVVVAGGLLAILGLASCAKESAIVPQPVPPVGNDWK